MSLVSGIRGGDFFLAPRSERCTETCDYSQVCRIAQSRGAVSRKTGRLELPMIHDAAPIPVEASETEISFDFTQIDD